MQGGRGKKCRLARGKKFISLKLKTKARQSTEDHQRRGKIVALCSGISRQLSQGPYPSLWHTQDIAHHHIRPWFVHARRILYAMHFSPLMIVETLIRIIAPLHMIADFDRGLPTTLFRFRLEAVLGTNTNLQRAEALASICPRNAGAHRHSGSIYQRSTSAAIYLKVG